MIEIAHGIVASVMQAPAPQRILFYGTKGPFAAYFYMSNFARYPIAIEGMVWPTSEHYYQAMKYQGTPHEEAVRHTATPALAAAMGRDRRLPLRQDWEQVKDGVMRTALRAKFTQYLELREKLLRTGNSVLIEHTKNDSYWGDGGDGTGRNKLGILLMELREQLRNA